MTAMFVAKMLTFAPLEISGPGPGHFRCSAQGRLVRLKLTCYSSQITRSSETTDEGFIAVLVAAAACLSSEPARGNLDTRWRIDGVALGGSLRRYPTVDRNRTVALQKLGTLTTGRSHSAGQR